MREIIHIQAGQCGNQVSTKFWEKICMEHQINSQGKCLSEDKTDQDTRLSVYFNQVSEDKYVPRAIIVDLESGTSEDILKGEYGSLFKPDDIIHGFNSAGNNFAKGFYTEGAELIDAVLGRIRTAAEGCDNLQGFQLAHSCGGGTGSGLGSRIISTLKDDYSEKVISTFTVFPSAKVSDVVVEPYNATLTLFHLVESATDTFCLDNEALYDICVNSLKIASPNYMDMNDIISQAMCGITASVRFPGQLNSDSRKLAVNLIPFPRLHFLISSVAPLSSATTQQYRSLNVSDITQQMFDSRNFMTACDPGNGKYFAVASLYRGKMSMKETEESMMNLQKKNQALFIPWIPNNVLTSACEVPPVNSLLSGTFIGNSTSIHNVHERILDQCTKMMKRKAFLHSYTDEGMATEELTEAINSIKDLVAEYKSFEKSASDIE